MIKSPKVQQTPPLIMNVSPNEDVTNSPSMTKPEEAETEEGPVATSMLAEEENYAEPETMQEELNAILEAFFELVPEEDIRAYQRHVEHLRGAKVAEKSLVEPDLAPNFELKDQDGDTVSLAKLLKKGPVVLIFYRGKWCVHCNAALMRYSKYLVPALKPYNASVVAISPMMPDGTAFLASKRNLQMRVCSDVNCDVAKQFGITFTVEPDSRPWFKKWGDDPVPDSGVDTWELPVPATFVIAPNGQIHWSFLDNDPGIRAEVDDIVAEVAKISAPSSPSGSSPKQRQRPKLYNRKIAATFHFGVKTPTLKFWESNNNKKKTAEEIVEESIREDEDSDSMGGSVRSTQSEGGSRGKKKSKRRLLRKAPSAGAFLGRYMLHQ